MSKSKAQTPDLPDPFADSLPDPDNVESRPDPEPAEAKAPPRVMTDNRVLRCVNDINKATLKLLTWEERSVALRMACELHNLDRPAEMNPMTVSQR